MNEELTSYFSIMYPVTGEPPVLVGDIHDMEISPSFIDFTDRFTGALGGSGIKRLNFLIKFDNFLCIFDLFRKVNFVQNENNFFLLQKLFQIFKNDKETNL